MVESLELTLLTARGNIAYFEDGENNYYFRHFDGGVRPAEPLDFDPRMYHGLSLNPFAEFGRKFSSTEDAEKYIGAIVRLNTMFEITITAGYHGMLEKSSDGIKSIQEKIREDDLDLLNTVPRFQNVKDLWYKDPAEIYEKLKPTPLSEP